MASAKEIYIDRLIDKRSLVPYSSSHIDRLEKRGEFPVLSRYRSLD